MLKPIWFSLFLLINGNLTLGNNSDLDHSPYFDTTFLLNHDAVRALLLKEGFREVIITTHDGLNLRGLWLERPNALFNLISCSGFYPGKKEGMASLYPLVSNNCNILFFDARGHGGSEGKFLLNLHHYGKDEYKDIIGALEFVHAANQKPIIIHGICAGAFHASRALIQLQRKSLLSVFNVIGLIFDSGFGSVAQVFDVPKKHFQQKILPNAMTSIYKKDSKKSVQDRWLYKSSNFISAQCIGGVQWCLKPWIDEQETDTNIGDKIHEIPTPIFFIHATDDSYASCDSVKKLAGMTQKNLSWWIEDSEHACNHLKHKDEYQQKLQAFIDSLLLTYHS